MPRFYATGKIIPPQLRTRLARGTTFHFLDIPLKILAYRSASGGKRVAVFDAEIIPGVRVLDLALHRKPDGSYRVFSEKVRFDIAVANELAHAAVAAGGGSHDRV